MIGRLLKSISFISVGLVAVGCIMIASMIKMGNFPWILLPSHDYEYVLDNGLKKNQHIKGEIIYSFGSFAAKESYTQYEKYRTAAKTTGYYYIIPVGESGMAAVYIRKDDLNDMKALTNETYEYLVSGAIPQTKVHFEGVAMEMNKNLKGLEKTFRKELENMGYTESEVEEMLSRSSDGKCLVLYGPADMSVMYVMIAIAAFMILLGLFFIIRNYRKEVKYYKEKEIGG